MNALLILIIVTLTLPVPILLEVLYVHVTLDIQEMDSHVQVCVLFENVLYRSLIIKQINEYLIF